MYQPQNGRGRQLTDQDSITPELFEELHVLITARLAEEITAQQFARLEHLVVTHREARQLYLSYMQDTVVLRRLAKANESNKKVGPSRELDALRESLLAQRLHVEGEIGQSVKSENDVAEIPAMLGRSDGAQSQRAGVPTQKWQWSLRSIASAALIGISVMGLFIWMLMPGSPPPPLVPVAQLIETHHAQWQDERERLIFVKDGKQLLPGKYSLADGLAKIKFNSGAVAVIDARERPVTLELIDDRRAYLHQGRMTAHVKNEGAKGFAVDLPCRRRIVDRGTEFGIVVDESGVSDVYVLEGKIDAQRIDEQGEVVGHLEVEQHENVRVLEDGSSIEYEAIRIGEFVSEQNFDQKRDDAKLPPLRVTPKAKTGYATIAGYRFPAIHPQNQPGNQYVDTDQRELVDGRIGSAQYLDPAWIGWLDGSGDPHANSQDSGKVHPRIEFTLAEQSNIVGVEVVYLIVPKGAVYAPDKLEITLSHDDAFSSVIHRQISTDFEPDTEPNRVVTAKIPITPTRAKHIRLDFFNARQWTFIGEVRFLTESPSTSTN